MEFLPKEISRYANKHSRAVENPVLDELERFTHLNMMMPQMLSNGIQGHFLSFFSRMLKPQNILEIGTFTGYSAICMSEGLQEGGRIYTIDINEELQEATTAFLEKAGLLDRTDFFIGNALEIIPTLDVTFDLVFIDADKTNYGQYYDLVMPKLKEGGYIIADNVLWSGQVLDKNPSTKAKALDDFNKKVKKDDRVRNLLLPIRDGLMLIEKLKGAN